MRHIKLIVDGELFKRMQADKAKKGITSWEAYVQELFFKRRKGVRK